MPQPIGTGEIANRLRRLLDIRGKFSGDLDETLVPIVTVADASGAPYRQSGRRWFATGSQAGDAVLSSFVEFTNNSISSLILDRITLLIPQQSGLGSIRTRIFIGAQSAEAKDDNGFTTEFTPLPSATGTQDVAVVVKAGNGVLGAGQEIEQLVAFRPLNLVTVDMYGRLDGLNIVVAPEISLFVQSIGPIGPGNTMIVAASGFYFDDLRRDART